MEEMLGNVPGARQIYERWMSFEPDHHGWMSYIKVAPALPSLMLLKCPSDHSACSIYVPSLDGILSEYADGNARQRQGAGLVSSRLQESNVA